MKYRAAVIITDTYVAATRLRCRRGRWSPDTVHRVAADAPRALAADAELEPVADAVVDAVRSAGALDVAVDLIIPATWCFIRRLDWPDTRFRETTAACQLEEFIPLTLEEVACAFGRDGVRRVWAVAVPTDPLKRLLDRLERRRVLVERVRIDLFAAVAAVDPTAGQTLSLTLLDERRAALALRNRSHWLPEAVRTVYLPPDAGHHYLKRQTALTEAVTDSHPAARVECDLRQDSQEETFNAGDSPATGGVADADRSPALLLPGLLLSTVNHPDQPDLRTGGLVAPNRLDGIARQASRCAVLFLLLLIALIADAHWQRAECRRQLAGVRQHQARVFRQILPNSSVPRSPAMRLASERKRLEGLTRTENTSSGPIHDGRPLRFGLFNDLRDFVAGLPDDVRVRLLELTIDTHQLTARGQTTDHRDAERIADAVNRIAGLDARPPRTSRLKSGAVEFAIHARRDGHGD